MLRTLKVSTTLGIVFAIGGCTAVLGISSDPHTQTASTASDAGDGGSGHCTGTLYVRIASDFSGTATDIAVPHFWGLYDRLRQVNKDGGILGCPIDIQVKDNNYTGPATVQVVSDWRATDPNWNNVSTLFIFGTGPTTSAGPQLMQEKKIIIPGSYAGSFATPAPVTKDVNYKLINDTFGSADSSETKTSPGWPYVFYPATDYGTAIRLAIQAAWKLAPGRMSFAHDTAAACAYCVDPLAAGKSFVDSLPGMSIGRDLMILQTSVDATSVATATTTYIQAEIDHFKAMNTTTSYGYDPVTWIWSGNSVFASAIVGRTVALMQKKIDEDPVIKDILTAAGKTWKIRVMANNWGIGETTPALCSATYQGLEAADCTSDIMYGLFPVPRFGDISASAAMPQLLASRDTWAQQDVATSPLTFSTGFTARKFDDYKDVRYVQGYASAVMWETAVKAALAAGSTNPTGEELKNALEKFNLQDVSGLTAGPITFTTGDHRPQSNEVIYKVDSSGNLAFVDTYSIALVPDWLGY